MTILHIAADASLLVKAGAAALLVAHVGGGSVGIVSGGVAMATRKGGRLHRQAGNVFFAAMVCMTVVASAVAPFLGEAEWTNTNAGVFTFYLVATAWLAAKRRAGEVGAAERLLVVVPLGIVLEALVLAAGVVPGRAGDGFTFVYIIAGLSALAAACDVMMIRNGGLFGPARIARHVWRISLALFVAVGSFFLGQQKFLPAEIRGTLIPALPVFAVIGAGVFWMLRVRFTSAFKPRAAVS